MKNLLIISAICLSGFAQATSIDYTTSNRNEKKPYAVVKGSLAQGIYNDMTEKAVDMMDADKTQHKSGKEFACSAFKVDGKGDEQFQCVLYGTESTNGITVKGKGAEAVWDYMLNTLKISNFNVGDADRTILRRDGDVLAAYIDTTGSYETLFVHKPIQQ
ncbi:hypothetical protein K2X33_02850 [bacterium]|nr:hypothetical protein [bacterium]